MSAAQKSGQIIFDFHAADAALTLLRISGLKLYDVRAACKMVYEA